MSVGGPSEAAEAGMAPCDTQGNRNTSEELAALKIKQE